MSGLLKKQSLLAALAACVALLVGQSASAALTITNGDFEAGIPSGDNSSIDDVADWFDANTGNFWEGAWNDARDGVTATDAESGYSGEAAVVFSDLAIGGADDFDGAYLYQSIGTDAAATSLPLSFDWGNPQDTGNNRNIGLTVAVYESDGSFAAADNTDIHGASGVTLLDSASVSGTYAGPIVLSESIVLDLSQQTGGELFLRFNNFTPAGAGNNDTWPFLDNVNVVPEPASIALLGLAGIAAFGIRRMKK